MTEVQLISSITNLTVKNIKYRNPSPEQIKKTLIKLMTPSSDTFIKEKAEIGVFKIKTHNDKNTSKLLNEYRLKKIQKK